MFDVAIVGSGPAGAACAAFCARAGVQTLLLEREKFPREKVCGDCLNPACWPVLARIAVDAAVRQLPHGRLDSVEFIGTSGRSLRIALLAATMPRSRLSAIFRRTSRRERKTRRRSSRRNSRYVGFTE